MLTTINPLNQTHPFSSVQSESSIPSRESDEDILAKCRRDLNSSKTNDLFLDKEYSSSIQFCVDDKGSLTDYSIVHGDLSPK
jgi:hypothetical protein